MEILVMAALGACLGGSLYLVVQSLRGVKMFGGFTTKSQEAMAVGQRLTVWVGLAVLAALVVGLLSRWPVAAGWTFLSVVMYGVGRSRSQGSDEIERVEAIATWAEQIRDTIASAAGLQQALVASARTAPPALRDELRIFAARIGRVDLVAALRQLGDDINHPSADMVIAGLTQAAGLEAGNLGPLLSRLAVSIRDDVRMRVKIEVSRTRIRTSARIVSTFMLLTVAVLVFTGRDLLQPYATTVGQLWLVIVGAVAAVSFWAQNRLAEIPLPDRFVPRGGR